MATYIQNKFTGGEIAPLPQARNDIEKYAESVATCENFMVHVQGPVSNRPGLEFIGRAFRDTGKCRLIPFNFNNEQQYVLEFTANKMRVLRNGGHVLEDNYFVTAITAANPPLLTASAFQFDDNDEVFLSGMGTHEANNKRYKVQRKNHNTNTITAITKADPGVVTCSAAHNLSNGDVVLVDGGDMTELGSATLYQVNNVASTTFELQDLSGVDVDTSSYTTYTTGGTAKMRQYELYDKENNAVDGTGWSTFTFDGNQAIARIYTLDTPYKSDDLFQIRHAQSADTVTLTHRDYDPRNLTRQDHDEWTLSKISFEPKQAKPTSVSAAPSSVRDSYGDTITAITKASPPVVTFNTATPSWAVDGVFIAITGGDMTEIQNIDGNDDPDGYIVRNATVTTIELYSLDDTPADSTGYTTYTSSAKWGRQLLRYKVTAISDETGEESLPSNVSTARASDNLGSGVICVVTWSKPAGKIKKYRVYKENGGAYGYIGESESLQFIDSNISPDMTDTPPNSPARNPFTTDITGITNASPAVVTAVDHGFLNGERVFLTSVVGMTEVNNNTYFIKNITDDTFELYDENGDAVNTSDFTAYSSGGEVNDFPMCVGYHELRRLYGSQWNQRQTTHASSINDFANMNQSSPIQSDDAFSWQIPSNEVNEIKHIYTDRDLFLFTSGSVMSVDSGDSGFTFSNIRNHMQSKKGCSDVEPLGIDNSILFVENTSSEVNDLTYSFELDGFVTSNVSVLSQHIFEDRTIVDWAYARSPYSIVWCVFDDGTFAGLTYDRQQNVWAWHNHTTTGTVESVATIKEGKEDVAYFSIQRTVNGTTKRYIERLHSRNFSDQRDAFFVDAGSTLNSPISITDIDRNLTGDRVVILAPGHSLSDGDFVDITGVGGSVELNDNQYKATSVSGDQFELTTTADVDVAGSSITAWTSGGVIREAVTVIPDLEHLEGLTVSVLANGAVPADKTVSGGSITLTDPASRVHVGLPYTATLRTLPLESPDGQLTGVKRNVAKVFARVNDSRGLWAGPDTSSLNELEQREFEELQDPVALEDDFMELNLQRSWTDNGQVTLQQQDPLPLTLQAIKFEFEAGDN